MNPILIPIIGITLSIIGIFLTTHDSFARADLDEKSMDLQLSSIKDCSLLNTLTYDHKNDWFPDNYVKIAEKRMKELNCK